MVSGCAVPADESEPIVVRFEVTRTGPAGEGEVTVSGLSAEELRALERRDPGDEAWRRVLPVQVGEAPGDQPALIGDYRIENDRLHFRPRFPFAGELTYHARWLDPDSGEELARASLRLQDPTINSPPPRVVAIYPSSERLPENLLRFYVQFSMPMSRERAQAHIRLIGPDGPVEVPFVAPDHELWNQGRDRLTLVLDPGRLKRGVGPNLERGPVLTNGETFRLEVTAGWPDGSGREMAESFTKTFRVGAADRTRPLPADWEIYAPDGPSAPIEIRFPAPLDHAMLSSAFRVETDRGRYVGGRVEIGDDERRWQFYPEGPWPSDGLRVIVDERLEDPSGNRVDRLFDEALGSSVGAAAVGPIVFELTIARAVRG